MGPGTLVGRNARQEAQEVVGDRLDCRVLEPSPPAVSDGEWFADDPVAVGTPRPGRPVVSPVPGADLTWSEWLVDHPEHSEWASARWLGAYRRLPSPPATLPQTRLALHRVAVYVISPARRRANGKLALRWTLGGLGTPFFGADEQVRVEGEGLVRQRAGTAVREPITSLARAAALALDGPPDVAWAADFDVPPPGDPERALDVDPEAAAYLGQWFGFAWSVLEELRADPASVEPSRVQLWPEHLDAAFDCLPEGRRATFGASLGDRAVEQPYLYVLPSAPDVAGLGWNAESFPGAILPLALLLDADDQRAAALAFFRERRALLEG
jgi:hypothetical protein